MIAELRRSDGSILRTELETFGRMVIEPICFHDKFIGNRIVDRFYETSGPPLYGEIMVYQEVAETTIRCRDTKRRLLAKWGRR